MLRNTLFVTLQLTRDQIHGIGGNNRLALIYPREAPGIGNRIEEDHRGLGSGTPSPFEQSLDFPANRHNCIRLASPKP